jgi:hypothetical protein
MLLLQGWCQRRGVRGEVSEARCQRRGVRGEVSEARCQRRGVRGGVSRARVSGARCQYGSVVLVKIS